MKAVRAESKKGGPWGQGARGNDDSSSGKRFRRRVMKMNPASPPTTLELHGTRIHFPFRPYKCQEAYMTKVLEALMRKENALLESPTGTGKTLCLLCASLAWQRQESRELEEKRLAGAAGAGSGSGASRVPTIIYASRTHSQLSQVARELQSTRYRPLHAVLGSREQMCVNPKVKKAGSTASDINFDCNKLGKDRRCRYRNNLEGFVAPPNEEAACGAQPVMDMEDLVEMGKSMKVCPFYYTRSQVEKAELILMPYNYLFSKDARDTTLSDIPWDNAVVIFDEAHNLESFASESASFDLSNTDIAGCIGEIDRAIRFLIDLRSDQSHGVKLDNLVRLKSVFLNLEAHIFKLSEQQSAYSGEFMMDILQRGATINHANHQLFLDELGKVNDFLMDMRQGASKSSPHLEHFALCIKRVYGHQLESRCLAKAAFYRVHVSSTTKVAGQNGQAKQGRTISYWCFAPSLAMEELAALKVRSIIVTSGTLSPLPSYSIELGLKFPHTLENPHIIDEEQICVRVVGKGVNNKLLTSSFERRKDNEYYEELGATLSALARVTPAGMLVFFPSYGVMNTCLERWGGPAPNYHASRNQQGGPNNFFAPRQRRQNNASNNRYSFPRAMLDSGPITPWKRLLAVKSVVVEPKSSADLPDAISEFRRYLAMSESKGCILMGVCRGKISEGIDFSHEQSRAVVITGLPFPPSHDPKVKMKREFLEQARNSNKVAASSDGGFDSAIDKSLGVKKLSGNDWYTQQAHRAVNQAIGRVIRNSTDYGAVLLLDSRFDQARNQEGLSKWLRPHIKKDEGIGSTIGSLGRFFREADVKVTEKKKAQAKAIELEYEAEDEDTVTKFTCVRPTADSLVSGTDSSKGTSYVAPEQVVARGDLKELGGDAENEQQSQKETKLDLSQAKKPANNDAVFVSKEAVKPPRMQERANTNPTAKQFFVLAKETFPEADFSSVKKSLVALRGHAKNNDFRSYTQSAKDIVMLIVNRKDFTLGENDRDENMFLLFLHLLPEKHRNDVELAAFKLVFDKSAFGVICKEKLSAGYFGLSRSCTVELLHSLWGAGSKKDGMKTSSYLPKVQEIFRLFFKTDHCVSSTTLQAFLQLVPSRYAIPTQTLAQEVAASMKVEKMKQAEKANRGEASLNADHFKLAVWDTRAKASSAPAGLAAGSTQKDQTKVPAAVKPLKATEKQPPLKKSTGINPYARKRPASGDSSATASNDVCRPRKASTSLASLIKNVESDTYVKQTPTDLIDRLKNKAAKNMTCPICDTLSEEPYVAEQCGHVACLSCWKLWFKRSQTCPTCRVPTAKKDLALLVYDTASSSPPAAVHQEGGRRPNKSIQGPSVASHQQPRLSKSALFSGSDDDELEIC